MIENGPIRVTVDAPVDKMEDLGLWSAVKFSFDFLRVSIFRQLLPGVVNKQKQAVVIRIVHFKFLSTELANVLCSNVRSH